jgi:acyl-CoA thioesterase FadM
MEITMAPGTRHTHHVNVPYDLLDRGMTLHHPSHLVLAERARAAALEELGSSVDDMWDSGFALLVRSLSIEYLEPVYAGTHLTIRTAFKPVSSSALDVEQQFWLSRTTADGRTVGTGGMVCEVSLRLVCANLVERRVAALPEALRNGLAGVGRAFIRAAS